MSTYQVGGGRRRSLARTGAVSAALLSVALVASPRTSSTRVVYETARPVCHLPRHRGFSACLAFRRVISRHSAPGARRVILPVKTGTDTIGPAGGLTPIDLAGAYGFNPALASGSTQTVAIVDAYNDPDLPADLQTFDAKYGLPACDSSCLTVVGESGGSPAAGNDTSGWSVEQALDVETVHSVCEQCKILLVQANTDSNADLATAVNTAAGLNATEISNSYGSPETETSPSTTAAYNHPGIVITASTGDDGYYSFDDLDGTNQPDDPASLNTVVAVGGTSLFLSQTGHRGSELVWNDNGPQGFFEQAFGESLGATGGGCSTGTAARPWQSGIATWSDTACGSHRLDADIAAVADPFTGFDVYSSFNCGSDCPVLGWQTLGGTSLASPLIAAMFALAGGSQGVSYPALTLYGHLGTSALFDVTSGGNGWCDGEGAVQCGDPNALGVGILDCDYPASGSTPSAGDLACDAAPGYDGPTGVGTPTGLGAFAKTGPSARVTGPTKVKHGTKETWTAKALDPFPGGHVTSYSWNWGDGGQVSTGPSATHVFAKAGTLTIDVTLTDSYNMTGSATLKVLVK